MMSERGDDVARVDYQRGVDAPEPSKGGRCYCCIEAGCHGCDAGCEDNLHAELVAALEAAVKAWDNLASNLEDRNGIMLDSGCLECTVGTVPNKWNTGLCWYHRTKELLR